MISRVWGGSGIRFIYQALNRGIFILFLTHPSIRDKKPKRSNNWIPNDQRMAKLKAMSDSLCTQSADLQDAGPVPRVPAVLRALSLTLLIGLDGDLRLRCS